MRTYAADVVLLRIRQAPPGSQESRDALAQGEVHHRPEHGGFVRQHQVQGVAWQDYDIPLNPEDLAPTLIWFENAARRQGVVSAVVVPVCRCYRCGLFLTEDTVSADRIVPGAVKTARYPNGGTYVRENIRPACEACQSITGATLGARLRAQRAAARARKRAAANLRKDLP